MALLSYFDSVQKLFYEYEELQNMWTDAFLKRYEGLSNVETNSCNIRQFNLTDHQMEMLANSVWFGERL
ncbi:hypothetical protein [Candidatus Gromoviella agglomerans]|uniref:hypothetical protein n=1 Tax=Candidatus Gromoviella agglomerans TaxID=2806609 RepID=UPI001E5F8B9B|nr:hypothetical protein [Candidatus Gromoviella agglomerans]UFX98242.1 hypothetical protein Gromo_00125 [Candidatus Gromoviella agglomerans]